MIFQNDENSIYYCFMIDNQQIIAYYDNLSQLMAQTKYNLRHEHIKKTLSNFIELGNKILDVGCGIGEISQYCAEFGNCQVVGIDISPKMIITAQKINNHPNIKYLCADFIDAQLDNDFDMVLLNDVFEHIPKDKIDLFVDKACQLTNQIYLNIPDNKFLDKIRKNNPSKLQIIDESYSQEQLLLMFKTRNFLPHYVNRYGVDEYPQYLECVFHRNN